MTHTPGRDASDRPDGDRGYFRQPGKVVRAKQWCAAAAFGLCAAWAAHDFTSPGRTASTHSPGTLASPHALWETDCADSHDPYTAADVTPGSVFRAGERWHAVMCEKCHAGPPHHAAVDAEGEKFHARCAKCHHDHEGRAARPARVADEKCVRCHENL